MNTVLLLLVSCTSVLLIASGNPQVIYSPFGGYLNSSARQYYAVQYLGNEQQALPKQDYNLTHGEVDAPNDQHAEDNVDENVQNFYQNGFVAVANDEDTLEFSMAPYDDNLSVDEALMPEDDDDVDHLNGETLEEFSSIKSNETLSASPSNQTNSSLESNTEVPNSVDEGAESSMDLETNNNSSLSAEIPDKVIPAFVHPIHRPSSEWPLKKIQKGNQNRKPAKKPVKRPQEDGTPMKNRRRRRKPQNGNQKIRVVRRKWIRNKPNVGMPIRNPNINKPNRFLLPNSVSNSCGSCQCGVKTTRRMVGGKVAAINEFPWLALITFNNTIQCGGTLINDRHVVTAAHCVRGFSIKQLQLRFLEHNLENSTDTVLVLRRVSSIFSLESYNVKTSDNDIAILRLSSPIQFTTTTVRPICLPEENRDYTGKTGLIAGWGSKTEDGEPSEIIRKTKVPILSNEQCLLVGMKITNNMLCAGRLLSGEIDSCQGDSGGPLMIARNKRHYLAGVVSWGDGCAKENKPGIYTRVTKYLKWIKTTSIGSCKCS